MKFTNLIHFLNNFATTVQKRTLSKYITAKTVLPFYKIIIKYCWFFWLFFVMPAECKGAKIFSELQCF